MTFLAVIASLALPGTGHAFTGRWRPAAIWAAAGLAPVLGMFLWVPLVQLMWLVRIAAAIDAGRQVAREKPGTTHLGLAGGVALAVAIALFGVRTFVFEAFKLPASSMTPTLMIGDHFFVNKLFGTDRGDVVVFWHPTGLTYVKRLIAVGGDTVAVRRGVLFVNGVAAPRRDLGPASYWDYDEMTDSWTRKQARAYEETHGGHTYRVYQDPETAPGEWFRDYPHSRDAFFTEDGDPCASRPMMEESRVRRDPRPQMTITADGTACTVPPGTVFLLGDNRDNSNDSRSWGVVHAGKIVGEVAGIWWSSSAKDGRRWSRLGGID